MHITLNSTHLFRCYMCTYVMYTYITYKRKIFIAAVWPGAIRGSWEAGAPTVRAAAAMGSGAVRRGPPAGEGGGISWGRDTHK